MGKEGHIFIFHLLFLNRMGKGASILEKKDERRIPLKAEKVKAQSLKGVMILKGS